MLIGEAIRNYVTSTSYLTHQKSVVKVDLLFDRSVSCHIRILSLRPAVAYINNIPVLIYVHMEEKSLHVSARTVPNHKEII